MYSAHLKRFVAHSDKRCPVLFHPFFEMLFLILVYYLAHFIGASPIPAVHSSRTRAVTSPIVELYRVLFGA